MNFKFIFGMMLLFSVILISINYSYAFSETILITSSNLLNDAIFDGTWTFEKEWKFSSFNEYRFNDHMKFVLRSAHQDEYLYFYIDAVNDHTIDKGLDKATICIDGNNNKNIISDLDDFCFSTTLGNKQGVVFQGGSINGVTGNFQKISNHENFLGISDVSNEKNRYSKILHPTYEFKIPIDMIQRSDNYGFFISVYDDSSNIFYTWPNESMRESFFKIPPPNLWGDVISPDKSILN